MGHRTPFWAIFGACLLAIITLLPAAATAAPDVWSSLQSESAAGRIDTTVVDSLRTTGTVGAIVAFDDSLVLPRVEAAKAARGVSADDATAIGEKAAGYASLKAVARAQAGSGAIELRDYPRMGALFMRFDSPDALLRMARAPGVRAVRENVHHAVELLESLPLISQPAAQAAGFTGAGASVAVLDTGLNYLYPSFGCTAPATPLATCKVAYVQDFAPDDGALDANGHGTNVAAIVSGVAPGARVIGLDVFNGGSAWSSDILAAIQWSIDNRAAYNIVAINMSLGASGSYNTSQCSGSWAASAFTNLRAAGILPIVAAGNHAYSGGSFVNGVSSPACTPGALAVGAVYDNAPGVTYNWGSAPNQCSDSGIVADKITCFSQSASYLGMLAPGALISAGGYIMGGTSQATPHVAGAVAVVAAANPSSTVSVRECALTTTGPTITDTRNGVTKHRLDVLAAAQSAVSNCGANNPTPSMSTLSPSSATAGGPGFTLTVNGSSFIAGATVRWNGSDRTTTFVNAGQLTAAITAGDIALAGSASVTVFNPAPGGGVSTPLAFNTNPATNPVPNVASLSPGTTSAGGAAFTIVVTGSNFANSAVVRWAGSDRTTTFMSTTSVTASILAGDIAAQGSFPVTVFNPLPGGGISNASSFIVSVANNPVPSLTGLSPTAAIAGSAGFILTATGTGFTANSAVLWKGTSRATTFLSPTQLTIVVNASDVASAGTVAITVSNPAPGGGTSESSAFTVSASGNPVPIATALTPSSATAGGSGFTLTVTGSGFVNGAVVRWNGSDRVTTFVGATQLTATVLSTDTVSSVVETVTVFNPTPSGGLSNGLSFTVVNPQPAITNIIPSSKRAGSPAFTLTLSGSGFVAGSVVRWNGLDRPTTPGGATQISAAIPALDVASKGTATISVFNPAPGGGTSAGATFTVKTRTTIQGAATLNGSSAPDGYPVSVRVNGLDCGGATAVGGRYSIDADCDPGAATVNAGNGPNRSFFLEEESTYELDLAVITQFASMTGTMAQLWTGAPVAVADLGSTLPVAVSALFHWDNTGQQFRFWFRGFPAAFQSLSGLLTGGAYFVQGSGNSVTAIPGGGTFVLPSGGAVTLQTGVNGVVWSGTTTAPTALSVALPPEVTAVFGWDNASQGFDFWFRGFPDGFQTLQAGLHAWHYYFFQAGGPGTLIARDR